VWARALKLDRAVLELIFRKFEFSAFLPQNLNFSLNDLQNTKTPKLAKKSENNKTKGLTNTN
jgi:hypothetical protein